MRQQLAPVRPALDPVAARSTDLDAVPGRPTIGVLPDRVVDDRSLAPQSRGRVRHVLDAAIEQRLVVHEVAVVWKQHLLAQAKTAPVTHQLGFDSRQKLGLLRRRRLPLALDRGHLGELNLSEDPVPHSGRFVIGHVVPDRVETQVGFRPPLAMTLDAVICDEAGRVLVEVTPASRRLAFHCGGRIRRQTLREQCGELARSEQQRGGETRCPEERERSRRALVHMDDPTPGESAPQRSSITPDVKS